jgi:putative FmdB family regulatory protein
LPTYEYHCDECSKNFDVVQSFHDDPLTTCPTCGAPVKKIFGNVGIVFKGSGFYKTDSRGGTGKRSEVGDAGSDDSSSKGSESSDNGSSSSPTKEPTTSEASTSNGSGASSGPDAKKTVPAPTRTPAPTKPSTD